MNGRGGVVAGGTISLLGKGPYPLRSHFVFPGLPLGNCPRPHLCRYMSRHLAGSVEPFRRRLYPQTAESRPVPMSGMPGTKRSGLGPADGEPHHLAGLTGLRDNPPFIGQFFDDYQPPSSEVGGRRLAKYR